MKLEDLDLAEPEVLLLLAVVADVDELPRVAVSVVAEEDRLLLLELALELGARLVHRLVALQEFCGGRAEGEILVRSKSKLRIRPRPSNPTYDEDGEVLVRSGRYGDRHRLNGDGVAEMHLPPSLVRRPGSEAAAVWVIVHGQPGIVVP